MRLFFVLITLITCLVNTSAQCPPTRFSSQFAVDIYPIYHSDCTYIPGHTVITGNVSNLLGLSNITHMDYLTIENTRLENLKGLHNLVFVKRLIIKNNDFLGSLNGLESLELIMHDCQILSNQNLGTFEGLSALKEIGDVFRVDNNNTLSNFHGLENLEYIGDFFSIIRNDNLRSFHGLDNLVFIDSYLLIISNRNLKTLDGFNPSIEINIQFRKVNVHGNINLSICSSDFVCDLLNQDPILVRAFLNAPGCNSTGEIMQTCDEVDSEVSTDNSVTTFSTSIYPNPGQGVFHLVNSSNENASYTVVDQSGITIKAGVIETKVTIDLTSHAGGVYFVFFEDNEGQITVQEIVKMGL
ncbi:MAG: T9SS type A sorting domain-containing protein [Bacteroidota bacterium]